MCCVVQWTQRCQLRECGDQRNDADVREPAAAPNIADSELRAVGTDIQNDTVCQAVCVLNVQLAEVLGLLQHGLENVATQVTLYAADLTYVLAVQHCQPRQGWPPAAVEYH